MIYTVSLNPSLDYIINVEEFEEGKLNRSNYNSIIPGGKGIMVSKVLKNLGLNPINLGFLGGRSGDFIKDEFKKIGIEENFINIKNSTRINIKLKDIKTKVETEINAEGPEISKEEEEEFLKNIKNLKKGDLVILAGSIPSSISEDIYLDIIHILNNLKIKFIVDTTGTNLYNTLKYKPLLIKPNIKELGDLFNVEIKSEEELIKYGEKCLELGAENVIVSMGSEGALFLDKNNTYYAPGIKGEVINSVGSGDSMVAGYVYGYMNKYTKKECFKISVAAGTSTAFTEDVGTKDDIKEVFSKVRLKTLE